MMPSWAKFLHRNGKQSKVVNIAKDNCSKRKKSDNSKHESRNVLENNNDKSLRQSLRTTTDKATESSESVILSKCENWSTNSGNSQTQLNTIKYENLTESQKLVDSDTSFLKDKRVFEHNDLKVTRIKEYEKHSTTTGRESIENNPMKIKRARQEDVDVDNDCGVLPGAVE